MLDPAVFFVPLTLDRLTATAYVYGWVSQSFVDDGLATLKVVVGIVFILASLLAAVWIALRQTYHWLPLVLLGLFWGSGSIAGVVWGQSVILCTTDPADDTRRETLANSYRIKIQPPPSIRVK